MRNGYVSVYIRKTFQVVDRSLIEELTLLIDFDDGFVAFLNGQEIDRFNAVSLAYDAVATAAREAGSFRITDVSSLSSVLRDGANVLAIVGKNRALNNRDFSLSPALSGVEADEDEEFPPDPPTRPGRDLIVNELSPGTFRTGWVELYNPTATSLDIGGRRVGLYPVTLGEYTIPLGTSIAGGGRLVVEEKELGFEVDGSGSVIISNADGDFIDALNPRDIAPGHSTGRLPDGADNRRVFVNPTPNAANVGIFNDQIVINEIMFHPAAENTGGEYIELHNRSAVAVNLRGWKFSRGVDYEFGSVEVPPGGYAVLAEAPEALEARYELSGVLGPYTGRLSNSAEVLLLRDAEERVVDRVRFADEGSWPEATDGFGPSVGLLHPLLENRYGPAWAASDGEGTPGAQNSRWTANPLPVVSGVEHAPTVPAPGDAVQVLANASDEQGIASLTLVYEIDGVPGTTPIAMLDDGLSDDGVLSNGVYGASIPPQAATSVVAFWLTAQSVEGRIITVPEGTPSRAFLYQVEASQERDVRPIYRVVMRQSALIELQTRNVRSDVLLDATFVADGYAFYNRGIRNRGRSARGCNPLSYRIQFDHDRDFYGIKRLNLNGCQAHKQWIGLDLLRRPGIPSAQTWFRRLSFNGARSEQFHLRVESVDVQFLGRVVPGDDNGNLYRGEGQANLDYRGESFDLYRPHYLKRSNGEADDFSDIVDLCFRFSETADSEFSTTIEERIDVNQWVEFFSVFGVLGSTENAIVLNNGDDYFLCHRLSDDRWVLYPWDLDSVFEEVQQVLFRPTVPSVVRFLQHPRYALRYWCKVQELIDGAFSTEVVDSRIDHLKPLFPRADLQPLRTFAVNRPAWVDGEIQRSIELQGVVGGSLLDGYLVPSGSNLVLVGRAPSCGTSEMRVNGIAANFNPVTSAWTTTIDVSGVDEVEVSALGHDGSLVMQEIFPVAPSSEANRFLRCDANGDGGNDISDAVYSLETLFLGARFVACEAALDCNSDNAHDIADAIFNLIHLFAGGTSPSIPYPACDLSTAVRCEREICP